MTSPSQQPDPNDTNDLEDVEHHEVESPSHEAASRPDRRTDAAQAGKTHAFVTAAAHHLSALHCTDVIIFDVRNLSDLTDYIIIATGTSDRQIRSVSRDLEKVALEYDLERFGRDMDDSANWVVTDYIEVMVHIFVPVARAHYDLEMMWNDAPRIPFTPPAPRKPVSGSDASQDAVNPSEE